MDDTIKDDSELDATNDQPVQAAVNRYIELRDTKAKLKKLYEQRAAQLAEEMSAIEARLLGTMDTIGATSIRTEAGTVYKSTETYASVADWEAVRAYIERTGYWHILNRAVNRKEIRELQEQHGETVPGVNVRQEVVVNVRK